MDLTTYIVFYLRFFWPRENAAYDNLFTKWYNENQTNPAKIQNPAYKR